MPRKFLISNDWKGKPRTRALLIACAIAFVVFASPITFTYLTSRGLKGIYEIDGDSCGCGYTVFQYVDQTGYYDFVPGHGPRKLLYTLREKGPNEWVASRLKDKADVAFLRLRDGELYFTQATSTNEYQQERVYNLWRIWIPEMIRN